MGAPQQAALFLERDYPSCNTIVLQGRRPVLVDPGYGSGAPSLEVLLRDNGLSSGGMTLIVNTHFHCDHAGANYALQSVHGTIVAGHPTEAALVNARDADACRALYLDQPVEPYTIGRELEEGDQVGTGDTAWTVVELPGHTLGQIGLWSPDQKVLVSGDALHASDLGWINPYREGADALDRATRTIEAIAALAPEVILPGHGPRVSNVPRALELARRRLRGWHEKPDSMAWHACKRIFTYALMLQDGMTDEEADAYLRAAPWAQDHALLGLNLNMDSFIPRLQQEVLRANAATHLEGRWTAVLPYDKPWAGWPGGPARPGDWPPAKAR